MRTERESESERALSPHTTHSHTTASFWGEEREGEGLGSVCGGGGGGWGGGVVRRSKKVISDVKRKLQSDQLRAADPVSRAH